MIYHIIAPIIGYFIGIFIGIFIGLWFYKNHRRWQRINFYDDKEEVIYGVGEINYENG